MAASRRVTPVSWINDSIQVATEARISRRRKQEKKARRIKLETIPKGLSCVLLLKEDTRRIGRG